MIASIMINRWTFRTNLQEKAIALQRTFFVVVVVVFFLGVGVVRGCSGTKEKQNTLRTEVEPNNNTRVLVGN